MTDPISQNLDYVFFCYGLSYILVAAVTYPLQRLRFQDLPWWQLGAFSLLLGVVAWMNMVALAFGDTSFFFHTRLLMMIGADVLLLEFGRRSVSTLGARPIAGWITVLLAVIAVASIAGGRDAVKVIPRYVLAFPGGLMSAWGLWKLSRKAADSQLEIKLAALAMVLFAVMAGLITAAADFFPANVLNQEMLSRHTGLSAAFLRSAIALLLAYALSRFTNRISTKGSFYGESYRVSSGHTRMVLILIPILILGWYGTAATGSRRIDSHITTFRSHAEFLGTSIRLSLDNVLRGDSLGAEELAPRLNEILEANRSHLRDEYAVYILRHGSGRPDSVIACDTSAYSIPFLAALSSIIRHDATVGGHLRVDTTVVYLPKERAYETHVIIAEHFPDPNSTLELFLLDNARDEQMAVYQRRLMPIALVFLLSMSTILLAISAHRVRQSIAENSLTANRYRLLFDHSLAGNYVSAPDGRVLLSNAAFKRMLGLHEAADGLTQAESLYVNPGTRKDFLERLTQETALGHYAAELRRSDGRILHVLESATGTFDEHGQLVQIQGSIVDLTDRRLAEEAVRQREQLLRGIAAASQILITSAETESAIPVALAAIGKAAHVNRVHLFENVHTPGIETDRTVERFSWAQDESYTADRHPLNHRLYSDGFERWYTRLSNGETIQGTVSDLPAEERQHLEDRGIQSILACPIKFDNHFWGFVSFEDDQASRLWSNNDIAALSSAGVIIASAIERQRMEESLRIKNAAVESSISAIGLADLEGRIIYVNDAYCQLFGYGSNSEIVGKKIQDFTRDNNQAATSLAILQEFGQYSAEAKAVKRDGTVLDVHVTANMVTNDRGRPLCLMAAFSDISERKRSEDLLRNIAEHISAKTGPEYFNSVVEFVARELGVEYALIGKFNDALQQVETLAIVAKGQRIPNCSFELAGSATEKVLAHGPYFCEQGITDLFPDDFLLEQAQASCFAEIPLYSSTNQPMGLLAVIGTRDVTLDEARTMTLLQIFASRVAAELERSQAEDALRHSEERYRLMSENMSDVVWLMDAASGRVTYCSPSIERIRGFTAEEVMQQSLEDMLTPASLAVVNEVLPRAIREFSEGNDAWRNYTLQVDQWHRNGSVVHTEIVTTFLTNQDGQVRDVLGVTRDITERIQAAEALRAKTEELEQYFANSQDLLCIADIDGYYRRLNPQWEKVLGYAVSEMLNRPFLDFIHPDDLEKTRFVTEGLSRNQPIIDFVNRLRAKDGSYRWIEWRAQSEQGVISAVARDITERRMAAEALRQQEQHFQSLFMNMKEGVALHELLFDETGQVINYRILDMNPQFETILGIKRTDVTGKLATEAYGTETAPYLEEFSKVTLTGQPIHMETYFGPIDKHFSISVAPWGASGFATIFTDITERKVTEVQIRALNNSLESRIIALTQPLGDTSSLRLEDIFDLNEIQKIQDAFAAATGVASIITDTQGNPITRPSNFCHLCEHIIRKTDIGLANCYNSDAIIGRKHEHGPIMQPCLSGGLWDGGTSICVGDHHIANWLIGQVLEEPLNEDLMVQYAHQIGADESEFRAALQEVTRMPREQFAHVCQALYVIANQLSNLAVQNVQQARFITERKQAEEDRIRLEDQLRQALKLESIGHLAGGIAHDFNNMLTPIVGYAEMLQFQLSKDHPYQETLQQIIRAALRARDLTRQLLAFARKQTLAMKVLDLNEVVQNFEKMLRRTLRENVNFELNLSHGLRPFMADEGQIEQIILNLSINAQDAMPDGGRLFLETDQVELDGSDGDGVEEIRPGPYVMLSVSDTGVGIDKETIGKIFDPFFTTKGLGRGTGLGLSTVYGIVRQHGGHIHVYSEVGIGTTFRIYFPQSDDLLQSTPTTETSDVPVRGKETILLVEDEEQVRAVALEILEQYGYTVYPASDGDAALELAALIETPIHLLVTDIIMPTMNGRELYEKLVTSRPGLKTLYMSGYSEDVIAHHGVLEAGVNFIQKPFSLHAFASRVRQVLDGDLPA